jgi:thiamine transporter ThiT
LIIIGLFLFTFLPNIINSPLPNDPEVTKYLSSDYSAELICIIVFLSLSFILFLSLNLDEVKFSIREICELAMLVGLAVVLNFFPKIPLQWAGSINFQFVPLVIIALRFSPFKTFLSCGLIFGIITCFTDGYGLFAFPLEYLLAFGSLAIISPFRKIILKNRTENKTLGYTLSILLLMGLIAVQTVIRFICASIDSYIFYYAYLDLSQGSSAFEAALIYNAPYVLLTGVATMGVVGTLYYPLLLINKRFSNR